MIYKTSVPIKTLFVCFVLFCAVWSNSKAQQTTGGIHQIKQGIWKNKSIQYAAGQICVKLKAGILETDMAPTIEQIHGQIIKHFDRLHWGVIQVSPDSDIFSLISVLSQNSMVASVEPNGIIKLCFVPNDPYFGQQWNLQNTGQNPPGGTVGADIDATAAWNITTGSSNYIVGVLDTGIPLVSGSETQLSHPDLSDASRITLGQDETNSGVGVRDQCGHGTHVTGILGAETNNGIGVAGVAGNCKLLIVKAGNWEGYLTPSTIESGVSDAITDGAKILNCSFGSNIYYLYYLQIEDAVLDAYNNNVLMVCAAGNEGIINNPPPFSDVDYPGAFSIDGTFSGHTLGYNNVICVSATDPWDNYAIYSSMGPEVRVSAPGGFGDPDPGGPSSIYSTTPNYPFHLDSTGGIPQNYGYLSGTSMATPHVSGIAALMLSIDPSLSPSQIISIIENSANKVAGMNGASFTSQYGYGRVNAYQALKYTLENYGGTLSQTLTIPQGETWTFSPGVTLTFASGAGLNVNGVLNAYGTASDPITFTSASGTWGGIQFNSGSSASSISYCEVSNANSGIYENGVSVNISNSAIKNCTNGIYLYSSNPTIQNNNIHNNSYAGVYTISSSPKLYNNYLQNNGYGVYCSTSSNPSFGSGSTQGDNNVTGNGYGVFCWNNSLPMLGQSSPLNGGYDNLVNTSWNVYNMSSGSIYAQNNWWGTTNTQNFKIAGTGGVVSSPYLSSAVSIPAPPLNNSVSTPYASNVSDVSLLSELNNAYQLVATNDLVGARSICLSLITSYPDSSLSFNALNLLKDTYPLTNLPVLKYAYDSLFHNKAKKELYAMAGLIMADIDTANRLNLIDSVINAYKGDSVVELALFDKFVYYYFGQGDKQNALEVSKELDMLFSQSQGSVEAHSILGDQGSGSVNASGEQTPGRIATQTSTEYSLSNYPNPFNPTTTISYNLSTSGHVTVKIYDILGREVKTLVNEDESPGHHNAVFDASRLASGVYFYRLTAPGIAQVKKMVVTK